MDIRNSHTNSNKPIKSLPYTHSQRYKCIHKYDICTEKWAVPILHPHPCAQGRYTLPQAQRCKHKKQAHLGTIVHIPTSKTHTHTYTNIHDMHLKEDIFLALVLTTCPCKLDFQNILILCWHMLRQNRGGQTQHLSKADVFLLQCNVRNCWCRINAHFYEFILCHRVEKNLGVNIHHMA